nr:unnamed protein product [Digitaria exilis]
MATLGASPAAPPPWSLLCALVALATLGWAWRTLEQFWLRPPRLGRALRAQGLPGTAYSFPSGDMKEFARLAVAARSQPMPPASHAVAPRALPFDHSITRQHGEKWVTRRRIINHAFHLEKLKRMLPAFAACSSELIRRWEDSVGSGCMQEIDVWPEFQNLAGDVISRAAFGSSFSDGRRIFQLQLEQAQNASQMAQTMHIPAYRFLPTKLKQRMKANAREVEELLKGIITKRERAMEEGADNDDLLGLLLESNTKESQESGSAKPMMTTDDIIGELKLFYFAGMETTAVLLTWTMVILSMHPEWQDRAREEVLRIFGKNQPDYEGINQLKTTGGAGAGVVARNSEGKVLFTAWKELLRCYDAAEAEASACLMGLCLAAQWTPGRVVLRPYGPRFTAGD